MRRILAVSVISTTLATIGCCAAFADDAVTPAPAAGVGAPTTAQAVATPAAAASGEAAPTTAQAATSTTTAQADPSPKAKDADLPKTPSSTTTKSSTSSSSGGNVGLGGRVAGFLVGTIIGTPVAIVRKSYQESIRATKDLVGDSDNPFLFAAGTPLGVPAGILSGALGGPVVAAWHAWKGSEDEPFSKESFSLGDDQFDN